jgi:hypothetical protein
MLGENTGSRHAHVNSCLLEDAYPNLSTSWNSLAVVTMPRAKPAKASNNSIANHCQTRPVENCSSNELSCMVIFNVAVIDDDSRKNFR